MAEAVLKPRSLTLVCMLLTTLMGARSSCVLSTYSKVFLEMMRVIALFESPLVTGWDVNHTEVAPAIKRMYWFS